MANRNDHSDKKTNDAKTATTRQQDQERGQEQKTATGGATGGQTTRDKGTVPVADASADPEDHTGEDG